MDKIKFVRGNKNNIDKIKEFLYSQGARKDGSSMIGYDFGDNEFGFYVDDNVMTVVDPVITDVLGREHFNGFVVYEPVQSNQAKNSSAVIDFTGM